MLWKTQGKFFKSYSELLSNFCDDRFKNTMTESSYVVETTAGKVVRYGDLV